MLQENYLTFFLENLASILYFTRKASFLVQDLQDLMQDFASLARKILARLEYFLQDGFYWVYVHIHFCLVNATRKAFVVTSTYKSLCS